MTPSLSRSVYALAVAAAFVTACSGRAVVGHQDGGAGSGMGDGGPTGAAGNAGTAGAAGSAGAAGAAGTIGGGAGSTGTAGTFVAGGAGGGAGSAGGSAGTGSAGTGNAGGATATAGTTGAGGAMATAGTTGTGGTGPACPSGAGGARLPFGPAIKYPTSRYGAFVGVGQLNGDARPDIVVANLFFADQTGMSATAGRPGGDGGSVSVFLSGANGGYAAPRHYRTGGVPTSLAVGDLDADGKADVAVAHSSGIGILLNDGSGVLAAPVTLSTGHGPYWVAIDDLNGDGRGDLAVANRGASTVSDDSNVAVLFNAGQGTAFSASIHGAGRIPVHVFVGHIYPDSTDLIVANASGVAVLAGGGGYFSPAVLYGPGTNPTSAVMADLNGDDRPDIAVRTGAGAAGVLLNLLNPGFSGFAAATLYNFPTAYQVAIGDLNGDGKPDLLSSDGELTPCGAVTFILNNGNGTFGGAGSIPVGPTTGPVIVGDVNGDGKPDVIVPLVDGVAVLPSTSP